MAERRVVQAEALGWLRENAAAPRTSVVTSLPDVSEIPELDLAAWRAWFMGAVRQIVRWVPADGVAIFFQSDVRHRGALIEKGYLVMRAAEDEGASVLWHKIVCRKPAGTIAFGRPSYSHMIALSVVPRGESRYPGPDVLPDAGEMTWSRAMGVEACRVACRYLRDEVHARVVVDPFCGRGTALAIANAMGLDAIGVELSGKRVRAARTLRFEDGDRASRPLLSTREAFDEGVALFDAGAYWDAHEAWETRWRVEPDPLLRRFFQGLIQIAAALHKLHEMKNPEASRRIFARALAKLDAWPEGYDLAAFRDEIDAYARALETSELGSLPVPRIQMSR